MNKPTCYIYIGIPCSGKSTGAYYHRLDVISCDKIREEFNGKGKYVFNPQTEKKVWELFYQRLTL